MIAYKTLNLNKNYVLIRTKLIRIYYLIWKTTRNYKKIKLISYYFLISYNYILFLIF